MSRKWYPLKHKSYNSRSEARLSHGNDCVLLEVDGLDGHADIVLTAEAAHQLALALRQQAKAAKEVHQQLPNVVNMSAELNDLPEAKA